MSANDPGCVKTRGIFFFYCLLKFLPSVQAFGFFQHFEHWIFFDCHLSLLSLSVEVIQSLPPPPENNDLEYQTFLTALRGAKGIFLRCQTGALKR